MGKYFIVSKGNRQGPFTAEELKEKNISPKTLVWADNLVDWTEAENIEDLTSIITKKPPPFITKTRKFNLKASIIISLIIGVSAASIYFYLFKGFANLRMYKKLSYLSEHPPYGGTEQANNSAIFEFMELREESIRLGWDENSNYGANGSLAISFHKVNYQKALLITLILLCFTSVFSFFVFRNIKKKDE